MLVVLVGFVVFVGDVFEDICLGNVVCCVDLVGVGDGVEGFVYVGGVGYVVVGGEEDGVEVGGVGCVVDVGVG